MRRHLPVVAVLAVMCLICGCERHVTAPAVPVVPASLTPSFSKVVKGHSRLHDQKNNRDVDYYHDAEDQKDGLPSRVLVVSGDATFAFEYKWKIENGTPVLKHLRAQLYRDGKLYREYEGDSAASMHRTDAGALGHLHTSAAMIESCGSTYWTYGGIAGILVISAGVFPQMVPWARAAVGALGGLIAECAAEGADAWIINVLGNALGSVHQWLNWFCMGFVGLLANSANDPATWGSCTEYLGYPRTRSDMTGAPLQ